MQRIRVKVRAYKKLVKCYRKHTSKPRSPEWDAVFSCNPNREAWPCQDYGYSQPDDRVNVQMRYKLLRKLVNIVLDNRPDGGRFFLHREGVFVKPEWEDKRQIAYFEWREGRSG